MDLLKFSVQSYVLLVCCSTMSLPQVTPACGIWGMPCPSGPCAGFTCGQNSRCSANQRCECLPGFERPCTDRATAVITCTDIDECLSGTHRCPITQSRCANNPGGYSCVPFCRIGFENLGTGVAGSPIVCRDIDECGGRHQCHSQARCVNTEGSYSCECQEGYEGDGRNCAISRIVDDVDECEQEGTCHPDAMCVNTRGSYLCWCRRGYTGNGVDTCDDVDECRVADRCHRDGDCINTLGSYRCACATGYSGDGMVNCTATTGCDLVDFCHANATCLNDSNGNYTCHCAEGYTGDGVHECSDINECEILGDSACGLDSNCINTNGSFNCTCVGDSCSGVTIGSTEISFNDRTLEYFGIGLAILASLMTALILGWLIRRKRRRSTPLVDEDNPSDHRAIDNEGVTIEPIWPGQSSRLNADPEQGGESRGITPQDETSTSAMETSNSAATDSRQSYTPTSTTRPVMDISESGTEASPNVITPTTSDNVQSAAGQPPAHAGNLSSVARASGAEESFDLSQSDAGSGSVGSPQSMSQSSSALDATLPAVDEVEVWQGSMAGNDYM